jgi:hypothetical protein
MTDNSSLSSSVAASGIYADEIASTATTSGAQILMLTAEDLEKIQRKRKRPGASAPAPAAAPIEPSPQQIHMSQHSQNTSGLSVNTDDKSAPGSIFSLSSGGHSTSKQLQLSMPANTDFDPVNFVHFYPHDDFSNFDMLQYFLDTCRFLRLDPFDPNIRSMSPDEMWSHRCSLRPKRPPSPPLSAADLIVPLSTSSQTPTSPELNSSSEQGMGLSAAAAAYGRSLVLRRLLPYHDPRRQFTAQLIRHFNNYRFNRLFKRCLVPDVHWSNHFIGHGDSPYGPNEVNLHGVPSVVKYYKYITSYVPDVVHNLVRSEIYITAQGRVLIAITRMIYASRVFRGITDQLAAITLTPTTKLNRTSPNCNISMGKASGSASTSSDGSTSTTSGGSTGDEEDDEYEDEGTTFIAALDEEKMLFMNIDDMEDNGRLVHPPTVNTVDGVQVVAKLRAPTAGEGAAKPQSVSNAQRMFAAYTKSESKTSVSGFVPTAPSQASGPGPGRGPKPVSNSKSPPVPPAFPLPAKSSPSEFPTAALALNKVELFDGRLICEMDISFCLLAPNSMFAERVWLLHFGVT